MRLTTIFGGLQEGKPMPHKGPNQSFYSRICFETGMIFLEKTKNIYIDENFDGFLSVISLSTGY